MSAAINNVTAPDAFSDQLVLRAQESNRVRLTVNNQAIVWQRGFGPAGGAIEWSEPEEFLPPGVYSFDESCDAVRFRAAVPAKELPPTNKPAQVSVALR